MKLFNLVIESRKQYEACKSKLSVLEKQQKEEVNFLDAFEKSDYKIIPENFNTSNEVIERLIKLQKSIQALMEANEQNRWHDAGLARFNTILTQNNAQQQELYNNITSTLTQYLNANQGALFLMEEVNEDEDDYNIQMVSCYAYNRKKHLEKALNKGEGLIGEAILGKETIFMTNVPSYYTKITSGLGEATPSCILIVPLADEQHITGAIELASFNIFTPREIKFVEALARNIASTLHNVKQAEKVKELYNNSESARAAVREQEQQILQQIEELQATNENMGRKSVELEKIKMELEEKNNEIERIREHEKILMESKLEAQKQSYELIITRLKQKLLATA